MKIFSSKPRTARRAHNRFLLESLEQRQLLTTTVPLVGTSGNDTFVINFNAASQQYEFSGSSTTISPVDASDFAGISVAGNGGSDILILTISNDDFSSSPIVHLLNDPAADGTQLSVSVNARQIIEFDAQTTHLNWLDVYHEGNALIGSDGTRLLVLDQLFMGSPQDGGTLDINDNDLIIHSPDAVTASTVSTRYKAGPRQAWVPPIPIFQSAIPRPFPSA